MMGPNTTVQSLEGVVLRMERLGGAIALADSGTTVNCLTSPIGRIPGTRLDETVPVEIGDASYIQINGTDIYCIEVGGTTASARFDYMFRGGLYPDHTRAFGNVLSETVLQTLVEMHSTPELGRYYVIPGVAPLQLILAPNRCSYLTIKPLSGPRVAALQDKARLEDLDMQSIRFGVILPSPPDPTKLLQEQEDDIKLRAFAASLRMWKKTMPHYVPPEGGAPVLDKDTEIAADATIACQVAEMRDLLAGKRAAKFPARLTRALPLDRVDARMGWKEAERLRDMQHHYEEQHLRRRIRSMRLTQDM